MSGERGHRQRGEEREAIDPGPRDRPAVADPRPTLVDGAAGPAVAGVRCCACGYPATGAPPRCPACGHAALTPACFGPGGATWSATVVRVAVPGREPPWSLAYVDLDDGPRVLARTADGRAPAVGARVRLAGTSAEGDLLVEVDR